MMKRAIVLILILAVLVWAGVPKPGPTGDLEPIAVKPVLVDAAKLWTIGKTPVAYYQRVKMPDGTIQELKSRTPLTIVQWQALSAKQWDLQVAAELNKPKPCSRCGGSGVEPQ